MEKTSANRQPAGQSALHSGGSFRRGVHDGVRLRSSSGQAGTLGFLVTLVVLAVLFTVVLPITAFMYMDILTAKKDVEIMIRRAEKCTAKCTKDEK
jgi:hypothetical protein